MNNNIKSDVKIIYKSIEKKGKKKIFKKLVKKWKKNLEFYQQSNNYNKYNLYVKKIYYNINKIRNVMKLKSAKYYYKNNRKVPKQIKQSEIKSKKIQNSRKILKGGIRCASWNIAAINNNPFEYHIHDKDKLYSKLMKNVENFIIKPGNKDITIEECLPNKFINDLKKLMINEKWDGVKETIYQWNNDFKKRKIINEFLKDKSIGLKRLVSMPDRITNTINTINKGTIYRPSVISSFNSNIKSKEHWWSLWKSYMFENKIKIKYKKEITTKRVCELLNKISSSKYPALSKKEELISLPLQTLCLAIFDCIILHILNTVLPITWQNLKDKMINSNIKNKNNRIIDIIIGEYKNIDVFFLQEVAAKFIDLCKNNTNIKKRFHILYPENLDSKRDQNSIILASKKLFNVNNAKEITSEIIAKLNEKDNNKIQDGDLFTIMVKLNKTHESIVLASFHGDTNGLSTIPVITSINSILKSNIKFIFGLDANTYNMKKNNKNISNYLQVKEFINVCNQFNLQTCWGYPKNWKLFNTTGTARTFLQPQLNKAIKMINRHKKGYANPDFNPKDFIIFYKNQFYIESNSTIKDNTGKKIYNENTCFPTLEFPSDHAIISTLLIPIL